MRSFKRETVILAVILVISVILALLVVVASGYIHKNLDYHLTTFNHTSWFPVLQNVIINTTSKMMYLDSTALLYRFDFTPFTEVDDVHDHYSISSTWLNFTQLKNGCSVHTYRDDSAITNFNLNITFRLTAMEGGDDTSGATSGICSYSTVHGTVYVTTGGTGINVYMIQSGTSDTVFKIFIETKISGAPQSNKMSTNTFNVGTTYYCVFSRISNIPSFKIYSNIERTNLIESLSIASFLSTVRYLNLAQSLGGGSDPNDWTTGYYQADYMSGGIASLGYAYSKNLLENETEKAFNLGLNQTVGANCGLKLYVSYDNSSWINIIDVSISGDEWRNLEQYNYTSLYCKFELTSNNFNNVNVLAFWFTNLISGEDPPEPPPPEGLELMYVLAAVVCVGLGALAGQARKPG